MWCFIICSLLVTGCSLEKAKVAMSTHTSEVLNGVEGELRDVIVDYFDNFDDVYGYKEYVTENFLKQVYRDCTDDNSDTKTLDQMAEALHQINLKSVHLLRYDIIDLKSDEDQVKLHVHRDFSHNSSNNITYIMIKENGIWKFDKILRF